MIKSLLLLFIWSLTTAQASGQESQASSKWVETTIPCSHFHVIVSRENPIEAISRSSLDRIFLKKRKTWENWEQPISPVSPPEGPAQEAFAHAVHTRSSSALRSYWQRQIFSGRGVPPDILERDQDVLLFVAKNPGAIGYVSCEIELTDEVKVIHISDPAKIPPHAARYTPAPEKKFFLRLVKLKVYDSAGDVQIARFGACGRYGGEQIYIRNLDLEQSRSVEVESLLQHDGRLRSRSRSEYVLKAGEQRFLGCSRPIADGEMNLKITSAPTL